MTEIIWLEQAYDDLDELFLYPGIKDIRAAERYCSEIEASCMKLRRFPDLGRRYDSKYRVLVVRNHLIFYRHIVRKAQVAIVRVLYGRRDIQAVLPKSD